MACESDQNNPRRIYAMYVDRWIRLLYANVHGVDVAYGEMKLP